MPDPEVRPEERLLAVLLRNPKSAPDISMRAHFTLFQSPILSTAFDVAVNYCCETGSAPTREILLDLMGRRDPDGRLAHGPALDRIKAIGPTVDEDKHVAYYCELLERDWKRRTVEQATLAAAEMLDKGQVDEAIESIQARVNMPITKYTKSELGSDFNAFWADYEDIARDPRRRFGVKTGFRMIDDATHGHFRKELWVVVGGSGVGKSLFLGQIACTAARAPERVLLVTIENSLDAYRRRLYSNLCEVPYDDLKTASLSDAMRSRLMEGIAALPPEFCLEVVHMTPPCCARDILNIMRAAPKAYDYLIVDQITNMAPNHQKDFKVMDWRWYSQIALELRIVGDIAYNLRGIPVLTAVHAAGGTTDKKELTTDDTALAKAIGYHADGMLYFTKKDGEYVIGKSKLRDAFFEPFQVFPIWEHWALSEQPPAQKYGQTVDQAQQAAAPAPAAPRPGGPDTSFDPDAIERQAMEAEARDLMLASQGETIPDDFVPEPPAAPPPPGGADGGISPDEI
jgi:DnaB helicase-like protein